MRPSAVVRCHVRDVSFCDALHPCRAKVFLTAATVAAVSLSFPLFLLLSFLRLIDQSSRVSFLARWYASFFSPYPPLSIAAAEINVPRRLSWTKLNVDGDYIAAKSWGFYKSWILELQFPLAVRLLNLSRNTYLYYWYIYIYSARNDWQNKNVEFYDLK